MFDAAHAHQGHCLCHCSMPAAGVLICGELLKIHAGVVGPDVPRAGVVAGVLENLMFRQLILCLNPCLIHVDLHVDCAAG